MVLHHEEAPLSLLPFRLEINVDLTPIIASPLSLLPFRLEINVDLTPIVPTPQPTPAKS